MTKPTRIAIEVFLPAVVAAVSTPAYLVFVDYRRLSAANVPLLAGVVFGVTLIPSSVYMVLIETARWSGLGRKKPLGFLSPFFGAIIGWGFLAAIGDNEIWMRSMADYLFVVLLGAGAGALVSLVLSKKEKPTQS